MFVYVLLKSNYTKEVLLLFISFYTDNQITLELYFALMVLKCTT